VILCRLECANHPQDYARTLAYCAVGLPPGARVAGSVWILEVRFAGATLMA
jgi:hypothetical protein